jgi:hypothetical protein
MNDEDVLASPFQIPQPTQRFMSVPNTMECVPHFGFPYAFNVELCREAIRPNAETTRVPPRRLPVQNQLSLSVPFDKQHGTVLFLVVADGNKF